MKTLASLVPRPEEGGIGTIDFPNNLARDSVVTQPVNRNSCVDRLDQDSPPRRGQQAAPPVGNTSLKTLESVLPRRPLRFFQHEGGTQVVKGIDRLVNPQGFLGEVGQGKGGIS